MPHGTHTAQASSFGTQRLRRKLAVCPAMHPGMRTAARTLRHARVRGARLRRKAAFCSARRNCRRIGPKTGILPRRSSAAPAVSVPISSSLSSALSCAAVAVALARRSCTPSASSHTPVEKKRRSPGGTDTSFLAQPLGQSSQKRSRPSCSLDLESSGRCTHQPPLLKDTSCSPSKVTILPPPRAVTRRVWSRGPTSSSLSPTGDASKSTSASTSTREPDAPHPSIFLGIHDPGSSPTSSLSRHDVPSSVDEYPVLQVDSAASMFRGVSVAAALVDGSRALLEKFGTVS